MSSNLLKADWVSFDTNEKRMIDADELFSAKIAQTEIPGSSRPYAFGSFDGTSEVDDGLEVGQMEALLGDASGEDAFSAETGIQQETQQESEPVYEGPTRDELIAQAQEEIRDLKENAREEIERMKNQAYQEGMSQGQQEGYQAGFEQSTREVEAMKQQLAQREKELQQEYEQKLNGLEPLFVDHMTEIYEHVFKVDLSEDREIVMHLLDTALHKIESGRNFIIRVSKDDYPLVSMQKKKLIAGMSGASVEVVEDLTLKRGDSLIETGGGIFDCSVDVELFSLGKRLKLLARNGET